MARTLTRPEQLPVDPDGTPFTQLTWRSPTRRYDECPQVTADDIQPSARGFLVEDELWFDAEPIRDHVRWWNDVIGNEYGYSYDEWDEYPTLFFAVVTQGTVVVERPTYAELPTYEAVYRIAYALRELDVPDDVEVHWIASYSGILRNTAADYYRLIS